MPVRWQEGGAQTVRVRIRNAGGFPLRGLELRFAVPYALRLDRLGPERYDVLAPAAVRETAMPIRALARLESGSLHVMLATANGGGLMVRKPFRIEAQG